MGHYLCPRCGSTDSFLGTILVNRTGVAFTQEVGDSGVYTTSSTGGMSPIKVVKCTKCSELLTQDNYVKSRSEIERDEKEKADSRIGYNVVMGIVGFFALLLFIILLREMAP